jgi:hypothetical protein
MKIKKNVLEFVYFNKTNLNELKSLKIQHVFFILENNSLVNVSFAQKQASTDRLRRLKSQIKSLNKKKVSTTNLDSIYLFFPSFETIFTKIHSSTNERKDINDLDDIQNPNDLIQFLKKENIEYKNEDFIEKYKSLTSFLISFLQSLSDLDEVGLDVLSKRFLKEFQNFEKQKEDLNENLESNSETNETFDFSQLELILKWVATFDQIASQDYLKKLQYIQRFLSGNNRTVKDFLPSLQSITEDIFLLREKYKNSEMNNMHRLFFSEILEVEYECLLINAGTFSQKQKSIKTLQLRIIYTLLYCTGARINQLRYLEKDHLEQLLQNGKCSVLDKDTYKTSTLFFQKEFLSTLLLTELEKNIQLLFHYHGFHYLCSSNTKKQPWDEKVFIKLVNKDMQQSLNAIGKYQGNYTTYSFRLGFIKRMLEKTDIQTLQQKIHFTIQSNKVYQPKI